MANKFEEKRIEVEMLGRLYKAVESEIKDVQYEYKVTGKSTEQAKNWRTGELLWQDAENTVPLMADVYGSVKKEELSEDDQLRITVYKRILAALEKMI
jgi:hypothetical protein